MTNSIQTLTTKPDNINSLLGKHEYLAANRKTYNSKDIPYGTWPVDRPHKESIKNNKELNDIEEEQEDTPKIVFDQDDARLSKILEEEMNKKIIHKKKSKVALPVLATMAEPYDILEDLA